MLLIKNFFNVKAKKKEKVKQKLKKAFFFWSYFDPLSFQHLKNSQIKIKTSLGQKIKYFKEFSIHSTSRLWNNNQQVKQKELFLLKQFLINLEIQKNAIEHLNAYHLKRFIKTEILSFKKVKQGSKSLQALYCLEDFLNV